MRNPSVQITAFPLSPSRPPKRQQPERTGKIISADLASGTTSPRETESQNSSQSHTAIAGRNGEVGTESDKPENSKSKNPGDINQSGEGWQTCTPTPRGCSQPSPSRLSPARGRTGLCSPRGRTEAGRGPGARQRRGQETPRGPTHLRLHGQHRPTRARGARRKRTGRRGFRDPRSLAGLRHKPRVCGAPGLPTDATPATFEFQPSPPFSPPSARKGQSSPSPRPRPIAAPPASGGHTPPGRHLPLPASPARGRQEVSHTSGCPPTSLAHPASSRGRAALPLGSRLQHVTSEHSRTAPRELSGVGAGTLGERNHARAHGTRLGGGTRRGSPRPQRVRRGAPPLPPAASVRLGFVTRRLAAEARSLKLPGSGSRSPPVA